MRAFNAFKKFFRLRKCKFKDDKARKLPFSQKKQIVILALEAHILTRKNVLE
jgi:hypothetical protein